MIRRLFLILMMTVLQANAQENTSQELMLSTLWVQNSAEYSLLTESVFTQAQKHLKAARRLISSAALEQDEQPKRKRLPPVVIFDLDETLLDNSAFQGYLIKTKQVYTQDLWNRWVQLQQAKAIPGAVNFVKVVKSSGMGIFYVTNRACITPDNCPAKKATMENMKNLGFPDADNPDIFLLKNEHDDWSSDKTNRRRFIAQSHHIVMLVGDDLNDFISTEKVKALRNGDAELKATALKKIGSEWFLLPNPMYGSWLQNITDKNSDLEASLQPAPL